LPETFKVGMAQAKLASPPDRLACFGVGSCVCVALYDPEKRLGGLVHSMLPLPPGAPQPEETAKYVETAVPDLVAELEKAGASRKRIYARLIGGANMFAFPARQGEAPEPGLGDRNLRAARESLRRLNIVVTAEESGGSVGRSLEFDPADGSLLVRTAWAELRWL
jgi:chemotaxis protein CheD